MSTRRELILLGAAPRRVLGVIGGLVGRCLKIQLASTLRLFLPLYKLSCIVHPATVGKPKAGEYMLRIVRQKASRSLGHGWHCEATAPSLDLCSQISGYMILKYILFLVEPLFFSPEPDNIDPQRQACLTHAKSICLAQSLTPSRCLLNAWGRKERTYPYYFCCRRSQHSHIGPKIAFLEIWETTSG